MADDEVPQDPARGDATLRHETPAERMDRNWNELLQEFRVAQTGIQVIFGFLLILPFQFRFAELDEAQMMLYFVVFACMALATICILAPVVAHRILFRQKMKQELVDIGHGWVKMALLFVGLALAGSVGLVTGFVLTPLAGWIALGIAAVLTALVWLALPILSLHRRQSDDDASTPQQSRPRHAQPGVDPQ